MVQGRMDSRRKKEGWKDRLGDHDSRLVVGDQGQVWVATIKMQREGRGWEMKRDAGMKEGAIDKEEEEKSRSNPGFELPWFWEWWWEWWKSDGNRFFFLMFSFRAVSGLSCCMWALCCMDPLVVAHRLSSCPEKYGILPSRDQTWSPVLEGRFLTPEPPGESWEQIS